MFETVPLTDALDEWTAYLEGLLSATSKSSPSDDDAEWVARHAGPLLFPLIEEMGEGDARRCLKSLGYTGGEADRIVLVFRNGLMHSLRPNREVFDDGPVHWQVYTTSTFPQTKQPARHAFTYYESGGTYRVNLELHFLMSQIAEELRARRAAASASDTVKRVVGRRVASARPRRGLQALDPKTNRLLPHPNGKP